MRRSDPRHGTTNGYQNLGCRCPKCREAQRVYMLGYWRRKGKPTRAEYVARLREENDTHGREARYGRGCRCELCVEAANSARRKRRQANPGARDRANAKRMERYWSEKSQVRP